MAQYSNANLHRHAMKPCPLQKEKHPKDLVTLLFLALLLRKASSAFDLNV